MAILTSLAMTSVRTVAASARQATCKSQMRQLVMGCIAYRTENNGQYPLVYEKDPWWNTWSTWVYKPEQGRWQHFLEPYLGTYKVFNCPDSLRLYPKAMIKDIPDAGYKRGAAQGGGLPGWGVCLTAYNSQCWGRAETWTWAQPVGPMTETKVERYITGLMSAARKDRCPVFFDGIWQNDGSNQMNNGWGCYWPHRLSANLAFADGHLEMRNRAEVTSWNPLQIRD